MAGSVGHFQVVLSFLFALAQHADDVGDLSLLGLSWIRPLVASRMTGVPLARSRARASMPATAGRSKRAGEDGRVRGRAAKGRGESDDAVAVEVGDV